MLSIHFETSSSSGYNSYTIFLELYSHLHRENLTGVLNIRFQMLTNCGSVSQSCPTLWDPMDCGIPGFPILHHLPELAQTHVHWISDGIQPPCPLLSPSPLAFNVSQHQGLFWVGSLHQLTKELELQLHHQSFQWIFRIDFP